MYIQCMHTHAGLYTCSLSEESSLLPHPFCYPTCWQMPNCLGRCPRLPVAVISPLPSFIFGLARILTSTCTLYVNGWWTRDGVYSNCELTVPGIQSNFCWCRAGTDIGLIPSSRLRCIFSSNNCMLSTVRGERVCDDAADDEKKESKVAYHTLSHSLQCTYRLSYKLRPVLHTCTCVHTLYTQLWTLNMEVTATLTPY